MEIQNFRHDIFVKKEVKTFSSLKKGIGSSLAYAIRNPDAHVASDFSL